MSIAGRLGAVYFTRSQQFHQAPHSGCSFLSSPLTKVTQGLQQCRPSYCIAYHSKPLDAAPWSAARGLFAEKCKIWREKYLKIRNSLFNREKMLAIFGWNFEFKERCKGVHCVDLGESFPTSIYLQKSASIQPRTSSSKFYSKLFNIIQSCP